MIFTKCVEVRRDKGDDIIARIYRQDEEENHPFVNTMLQINEDHFVSRSKMEFDKDDVEEILKVMKGVHTREY